MPPRISMVEPQSPVAAQVIGGPSSRLLYATDQCSMRQYLVDRGAEVSVFPVIRRDKLCQSQGISLKAANNSTIPTFAKARRLSPEKSSIVKAEFELILASGTIQVSSRNWSSPLHMVPKSKGAWRPCGDYWALNKATKPDSYPVSHVQDFSARLPGCSIFSKINLVCTYHQIPIAAEDVPKTAVITPFGLFKFRRMPFGLRNAAQSFQHLMDEAL